MTKIANLLKAISALSLFLFMTACSTTTGVRMLDARSEYEGPEGLKLALKEAGIDGFRNSPVPIRTRPKVATVLIHPHEMPDRSYFWGGWVSVVVEQDQWVLTKPGQLPKSPGISEIAVSNHKKQKSQKK